MNKDFISLFSNNFKTIGNEQADMLAKKGSRITQTAKQNIPYETIKRLIKSIFIAKYDKQLNFSEKFNWKDFQTKLQSVPDLPRKSSVAMFRLITGHDCLSGHLFKIGLVTSPQCVLCNKSDVMNMNHLTVCEKLKE